MRRTGSVLEVAVALMFGRRINQYFEEHQALRTDTGICNTFDFGIGPLVTAENWKALRAVGDNANQRLCDGQAAHA
jgi:hypothetical protein